MLRNCLILDDDAVISESSFHPDNFLNNQRKNKSNSFFNPRSSSGSESSVRSPKSPFEFGIFSSFNSFRQRSQNMVNQKSWDHTKVGLSIIDDETTHKSHLLERKLNIDSPNFCSDVTPPKTAAIFQNTHPPKSTNVEFEIGYNTKYDYLRASSSLLGYGRNYKKSRSGSGKSKSVGGSPGNSPALRLVSITPEMEQSEEYTRVVTHGPNPKVTHYYGNERILNAADEIAELSDNFEELEFEPRDDLLKSCRTCKKTLEGEAVYMYRGEEAFCSPECRDVQIEIDEEIEKTNSNKKTEDSDKKNEDSDKPNLRSSSSKDIINSCSIFFTA